MNRQGMRVLAVSQKSFIEKDCNFAIEDEKEMVLIGYLAFLDPRNLLSLKLSSNYIHMEW